MSAENESLVSSSESVGSPAKLKASMAESQPEVAQPILRKRTRAQTDTRNTCMNYEKDSVTEKLSMS